MSSSRGLTLDSCPVELNERIFELACTDAGCTGRSLSLVSKYVNQTSKRYKLQCIALHGLNNIVAFVGVLERTPQALRRVRHLFFCDGDLDGDERRTFIHSASPLLLSRIGLPRRSCLRSHDPDIVPFDQGVMNGLSTILSLISPTIETLCLYFQSRKWMYFPSRAHYLTWTLRQIPALPRLSELTIGRSPQLPEEYLEFSDMPIMPSLQRLCLWGTIGERKLWEHIPRFAPSLTHLRLPGSADNIHTVRPFLPHSPDQKQLPPTLCRIFIQQEALPFPIDNISHVWDIRAVSYIQWAACRDERLVLLDSDLVVAKYGLLDPGDLSGYGTVESEWLCRISGGDGCWSEMKREEKIRNYPLAEGDVYWRKLHSGALDGFPRPYIPTPPPQSEQVKPYGLAISPRIE